MKPTQIFLIAAIAAALVSCRYRTAPELPGSFDSVDPRQTVLGGVLADKIEGFKPAGGSVNPAATAGGPVLQPSISALREKALRLPSGSEVLLPDSLLAQWRRVQTEVALNFEKLSAADLQSWVALNDSLLKYSGQVCFADELESAFYNTRYPSVLTPGAVKSVAYTRRYDRIYLNLYGSSSLGFEHTTGGNVRLIQDTDYPYDDAIRLKVEMEDTRYMDLYLRIPAWAEYASVTVHGVRYPVYPGQYAEVARKWKNGDEVEVVLNSKPRVLRDGAGRFAFLYGPLFLTYPADSTLAGSQHPDTPELDLRPVAPRGQMTTFTYSGIPAKTLVLQPFYAQTDSLACRTVWLK